MASIIRIKRRHTGAGGLLSSLRSGEIAWTDVSDILCIGEGDDGSGNANSVTAIGGIGAFVDLSNPQTIAGAKTFSTVPKSSQDASGATDLVRKSQHDSDLATKAPLASPALTGTPTAPTATPGTNTTQVSTTAFVQAAVSGLIDAAPGALDTLNELAAALGDDPNFATTITSALALKAPLASPALTGSPTAPKLSAGNNTSGIATAEWVQDELSEIDGGTF